MHLTKEWTILATHFYTYISIVPNIELNNETRANWRQTEWLCHSTSCEGRQPYPRILCKEVVSWCSWYWFSTRDIKRFGFVSNFEKVKHLKESFWIFSLPTDANDNIRWEWKEDMLYELVYADRMNFIIQWFVLLNNFCWLISDS